MKISVCMPVYNGRQFLDSAFRCLAEQTWKDFELVLVDDGSTDDSYELAQRLLKSYGLTGQVIRQANQGPEQARDLACEHAIAPIIAPYDCDDVWRPTYLTEMADVLERHPDVDLVYCDFDEEHVHEGKTVRKSHTTPWIDRSRAEKAGDVFVFQHAAFFDLLLQGQVLMPPCTMFRRSLYDRVNGYARNHPTLRISLDWDFGLRASRQAKVAYLDKPLLEKSRHGGNVSGNSLRTASCDVVVLEGILRDKTLTPRQRRYARARAAIRAADVAYQEWAINGDANAARKSLIRSLIHDWRRHSFILLVKTFIPQAIVRKVRPTVSRN